MLDVIYSTAGCYHGSNISSWVVYIQPELFNPLAYEKIRTDSRIREIQQAFNPFQLKPIHWLIHGLHCTRYVLQWRTNQFVGINFQKLPSIQASQKLNSMKSRFHLKAIPVAYGSQRVKPLQVSYITIMYTQTPWNEGYCYNTIRWCSDGLAISKLSWPQRSTRHKLLENWSCDRIRISEGCV